MPAESSARLRPEPLDAGAVDAPRDASPDAWGAFVSLGKVPASEHALRSSSAEILASDGAAGLAVMHGEPAPDGLTLLERHAAGGVYAMNRRGGVWVYSARDERGRSVLEPGKRTEASGMCEACHADAPHAGVFPLP